MKRLEHKEIPSSLFKWFIALYIFIRPFISLLLFFLLVFLTFLQIFKIIGILAPVIITTFTALFLLSERKAQKNIAADTVVL